MEIAPIITLSLGITGIFTGLIYFIITFIKDMKILDKQIKQSEKELEEMKRQTKEMEYANNLSLYELGILKFKPNPPEHLQNQK